MSHSQPILRPLLLTTVLAVGLGFAWSVIVSWCTSMVEQTTRWRATYEQLIVRIDGEPLIQHYKVGGRQPAEVLTLDRVPVDVSDSQQLRLLTGTSLLPSAQHFRTPPSSWGRRITSFNDYGQPSGWWYFVHNGRLQGAAYFVGYDSLRKTPLGYVGLDGFSQQMPPRDRWFPVDGRTIGQAYVGALSTQYMYAYEPYWSGMPRVTYLITGGRLLEIDFRRRTMRTLLADEGLFAVGVIQRALESLPPRDAQPFVVLPQHVLVRSRDRLILLDPDSDSQKSFSIPQPLHGVIPTFYEMNDGTLLAQVVQRQNEPVSRNELFWFGDNGAILRRHEVALQTGVSLNNPAVMMGVFAMACPAPLAMTTASVIGYPWMLLQSGEESRYSSALSRSLGESWPALLVIYVLAGVLAGHAFRTQRRYGLPWVAVWTAFVFIGGVPGLLAYFFHRRWAVREDCPFCGAPTPRDRDACLDCEKTFPGPEPKGIELFA